MPLPRPLTLPSGVPLRAPNLDAPPPPAIITPTMTARTKVLLGFTEADRGKLIMACGTGKTFTSLKIVEEIAGPGKRVLFLVPSLNLLSQTLSEWTQESASLIGNEEAIMNYIVFKCFAQSLKTA